jgi:hypothetical protein
MTEKVHGFRLLQWTDCNNYIYAKPYDIEDNGQYRWMIRQNINNEDNEFLYDGLPYLYWRKWNPQEARRFLAFYTEENAVAFFNRWVASEEEQQQQQEEIDPQIKLELRKALVYNLSHDDSTRDSQLGDPAFGREHRLRTECSARHGSECVHAFDFHDGRTKD